MNSISDQPPAYPPPTTAQEEEYIQKALDREGPAYAALVEEWISATNWDRVSGDMIHHITGLVARLDFRGDRVDVRVLVPHAFPIPLEAVEEFLAEKQELPEHTEEGIYWVWRFLAIP